MKKAKKFLVGLLAILSVSAFAWGVTGCDDDEQSAPSTPQTQECVHTFSDWEYYTANDYCEEKLYFRICEKCNEVESKKGTADDHVFETYCCDYKTHWKQCNNCQRIVETGEHIINAEHYCTVCGELVGTDGLIFDVSNGVSATVFGYTGADANVVIPAWYNGLLVTTIDEDVFYDCDGLTNVTIPDSVTMIGSSAFYDCDGLTNVTIPDSVTMIGSSAFYGCDSLTSVYYAGDIASWCAIDFAEGGANPLLSRADFYISNEKVVDLVIPDGVKIIRNRAFCGANFKTIIISDSVKDIERSAFANCDSLTSVTIPDLVTTIGEWAFYSCDNLTNVTIGNSVTTIESNAFYDCENLTSVVFADTSTWYYTDNYEDWQNKVNGTQVDVSDPARAADLLRYSYWYKL
ncbi:MAG: leucine-rich repeat domain-containing protein [Clostridiales bacterium]|nr:leucine-rich repeat domain-containing protein [Clostridiales bacterium]